MMKFPARAPEKQYVRLCMLRRGRASYVYFPANITSNVNCPKAPIGAELDNRIAGIPKFLTISTIDIPTTTHHEGEASVTNVQSEIPQCSTTLISLSSELLHNIVEPVCLDKIIPSGSYGTSSFLGLPVELQMYIDEFLHADYVTAERGRTPHALLSLRL